MDLGASSSCWVETGPQRWEWKLGGRAVGNHGVVGAKDDRGLDRRGDRGKDRGAGAGPVSEVNGGRAEGGLSSVISAVL